MKALTLFTLITLQISMASAQVYPILVDQLVEPSKRQPRKHFVMFEVGDIQLFNGDDDESKYFYILDKNTGIKIFEYDQQQLKARRFSPRFFKTEDNDELVILVMSLEGNYSWGIHIFIIENGKVSHPGYLSYGVDDFNFASLGLYSQFEQHNDWFVMFFEEDARLINYDTDNLIIGKDIEFKVEKSQITRIK